MGCVGVGRRSVGIGKGMTKGRVGTGSDDARGSPGLSLTASVYIIKCSKMALLWLVGVGSSPYPVC